VNVSVGWYKSWGDLPDYIQDIYEGVGVTPWELGFWRDGGHAMTMAAATISGPAREIGLRDPADPNDGQLDSQSAFLTNERAVDEMFAKFDGEYRTHDRIPSFNSKAFIDRITTIAPLDGLAADQQTIKLIRPFLLVGEDTLPQAPTTSYAAAGSVTDVALRPGGVKHLYLVAGDDAIWQLDVVTGESSRLATVGSPMRIVVGGPEMTVFALLPREVVALEAGGQESARELLSEPLADIAYDERNDRLVGVTARGDALVLFDARLQAVGRVALPALPCDGRLTLVYDPSTGKFWLSCDGSPVLRLIDTSGVATEVRLEGALRPRGLAVDDLGRLLVNEGDSLVHYDGHGRRLRGERGFTGMPGGPIVDIRRSFSNVDPATMNDARYRNVLPEDVAPR